MPTDWTLCSLQRQSAGVMSNDGFRCRDFQPREMSFRPASETPSQTKDCMHGQVDRKMTGDTSKKILQPRLLGRSVCFIYFVGVNEAAGYPKVRERQRPIADVPRVTRHLASRKSSTHLQVWGQGRAGLCMCWVGGGSQTTPFWYFHSVGNRSYKPPPPPINSPALRLSPTHALQCTTPASKTSPSKENKTIFHFRNQASWYIRDPPQR